MSERDVAPSSSVVGKHSVATQFIAVGLTVGVLLWVSCGRDVHVGRMLDEGGVTRELVGPAPPDVIARKYAGPSGHDIVKAIKSPDGTDFGTILELPKGRGVEVRSRDGASSGPIETHGYLTSFCSLKYGNPPIFTLVLYTYPSAPDTGTLNRTGIVGERVM